MSFGLGRHDPWNWDVNDNADSQEWQVWDNHPAGANQRSSKEPVGPTFFDNLSSNGSQSSNKQVPGSRADPPNYMWDTNSQSAFEERLPNQRQPAPPENQPQPMDNSRAPYMPPNLPVCNSFNQESRNNPQPPSLVQHSQAPLQMFPQSQPHPRDLNNEAYNQRASGNSTSAHYAPEVSRPPDKGYSKQLSTQNPLPSSFSAANASNSHPITSNNQQLSSQVSSNVPSSQKPLGWDPHGLSNVENIENLSYSQRTLDNRVHQNVARTNRQDNVSPSHSAHSDLSHPQVVDNNEIPKPIDPRLFDTQQSNSGLGPPQSNGSSNYSVPFRSSYNQFQTKNDLANNARDPQQPVSRTSTSNYTKREDTIAMHANAPNNYPLPQEMESSQVPSHKQEKTPDNPTVHDSMEQHRFYETTKPQVGPVSDQHNGMNSDPQSTLIANTLQFQNMSLNDPYVSNTQPPNSSQQNFANYSMDFNTPPNVQNPPLELAPKHHPLGEESSSSSLHSLKSGSLPFELVNQIQNSLTSESESYPSSLPSSHQSTQRTPLTYYNSLNSSAPNNSGVVPLNSGNVQVQQPQQMEGDHQPQVTQSEQFVTRESNNYRESNDVKAMPGTIQQDQGRTSDSNAFLQNEDYSHDRLDGPRLREIQPEPRDTLERKKLSKDGRQDALNRMYNSASSSIDMPMNSNQDLAQGSTVDIAGELSQRPITKQWQPEQLEHSKLTSNRDEYLETGNLSAPHDKSKQPTPQPSTDMTEEGDDPPPGLHRMVTGQVCDIMLNKPNDGSRVPSPGINYSSANYNARDSSTPLSTNGNDLAGRRDDGSDNIRPQGRLVQGQSIGEDNDSIREIPGEANPSDGRVVFGFMGSDTQQQPSELSAPRDPSKDLDRGRLPPNRMVVGDFRHPRNDSDGGMNPPEYYNAYRGRPRHHRDSPDYLSDEEYDDLRRRDGYHRRDRRPRDRGDRDPDDLREPYRDDRRYRPRYDYAREEDYYYSRSRPSSRSGSDYRRLNDYSMAFPAPSSHHMRNYYPAGPPGYPRDYSDFNKRDWTEFCDNYRRVDPIGYAHWYYSQYMRRANMSSASYSNDRASVHSGQSSTHAPGPLPKDGMDDEGTNLDDSIANEYNPMLYSTAHARGNIDSQGRVIAVDPHYPLDKQTASVRIFHGGFPPCDHDTEEFLSNPGPFVVGLTNKNIVLTYLKNIIERSTDEGEKLLCSLFYLMVKLNGVISGNDIAELLLDNYKATGASYNYEDRNNLDGSHKGLAVEKYRQHLLDGNKTGALEWAMEVGLWGHAFYLASKLDEKTYNNVLVRFTNSIPPSDPIQSLYQFLNGVIPQAATNCSDPKWADWRPHLAMLLSNQQVSNPDFTREAVITLAESLGSKGRLFESHFCHVVAQLDNRFSSQNDRMPLVGIDLSNINNLHTPCRPIMLTICYEFARRLSQPSFYIPSLLKYKLLLATRLIDFGKQKVATQYIETLANEVVYFNIKDINILSSLTDLGTCLKPFNPNITQLGISLPDPDWLVTLNGIYNNLLRENTVEYNNGGGGVVHHSTPLLNAAPYSHVDGPISLQDISSVPPVQPPMYTPSSNPLLPVETNHEEPQLQPLMPSKFSEHLPNEQHHIIKPIANYNPDTSPVHNPLLPVQEDHLLPSHPPPMTTASEIPSLDKPEPVLDKPKQGFNYYNQTDEMFKVAEARPDKDKLSSSNGTKKEGQSEKAGEKGWFGGILKRLNPLQRNQMHLPDDSNPSIVWDEEKKKWVNLDGGEEAAEQILPPPKMSDIPSQSFQTGSNLYKLQKGKKFKSNYVNVLNINSHPGDKSSGPNSFPMAQPHMRGPPADTSFLGGPPS